MVRRGCGAIVLVWTLSCQPIKSPDKRTEDRNVSPKRDLSAKEIAALKQSGVPNLEMNARLPTLDSFTLPDGRILVVSSETGAILYATVNELEDVLARVGPTGRRVHYLEGRDLGEDFLSRVPALLDRCRTWVEDNGGRFELSLEGLEAMDIICERLGRESCLESELYPMLVAAVGEVMRRSKNGRWQVREPEEFPGIHEIWIRDAHGWTWDAGWVVFKAMDEPVDLSFVADMALRERTWK
jgi:hypothetical protein